ncbi:MAG: glycosyltransferase involved in cell wall biosynthesis [Bradymonadia bacterium]|jgi:glycosyltransferase involved in cell wall biosynthesis
MSRSALIVSPFFVPMNVVGAKRALHFARHLPTHGWRPCVVALDETLQADAALAPLVPDVPLCRVMRGTEARYRGERVGEARKDGVLKRAWNQVSALPAVQDLQGRFSWKDRYAKHALRALPKILRFARAQDCEIIYANSGPPSTMRTAYWIARILKKPLVVDLRDPWSIEPNYRAAWTPAGRRAVDALEEKIFRRSAQIILNTQSSRDAYRLTYQGRIEPERFVFIRNQFDPDIYAAPAPAPTPNDPFRIVYYGHLRPSKNAQLFLAALATFIDAEGLSPAQLEVITLGEWTPADAAVMTARGLTDYVHRHGWLPFPNSPSLLGSASILLDLMGPNHTMQISGKFYDYLAAGRPIMSISPNTELDAMYAQSGAGQRIDLDEASIVTALKDRLAKHRAGTLHGTDPARLVPFEAATATAQLAEIFDRASGFDRASSTDRTSA